MSSRLSRVRAFASRFAEFALREFEPLLDKPREKTLLNASLAEAIYTLTGSLNSKDAENLDLFLRDIVRPLVKCDHASIYLKVEQAKFERHVGIRRKTEKGLIDDLYETIAYPEILGIHDPRVIYTRDKMNTNLRGVLIEYTPGQVLSFNLILGDFNFDTGKDLIHSITFMQSTAIPIVFDGKELGLLVLDGSDLSLSNSHLKDHTARKKESAVYLASASRLTAHILEKGFDKLTKLAPRSTFDRVLEQRICQYRDNEANFSLILLDIDHFKKVNDTYGHIKGDEVLRATARIIMESTRMHEGRRKVLDSAYRYGGEEIAVILERCNLVNAIKITRRLREKLTELGVEGIDWKVTDSFGVIDARTAFNDRTGFSSVNDLDAANQMLRYVDQALYHVKEHGRDGIATIEVENGTITKRIVTS